MSKESIRKDPRKKKTKDSLLQAFIALLREKDYDHIKIIDIYETAGISKNSFYNHFRSKEDLLDYLLDYYADKILEKIEMIVSLGTDKDVMNLYRHCIEIIVDEMDSHDIPVDVFSLEEKRTIYWAVNIFCEKISKKIGEIYFRIVDSDIDRDMASHFHAGAFANVLIYIRLNRKDMTKDEIVDSLMRLALLRRERIK